MKIVFAIVLAVAGLLAALNFFRVPAAPKKSAPITSAQTYFENFWHVIARHLAVGMLLVKVKIEQIFTGRAVPLHLCVVADDEDINKQLLKSLTSIEGRIAKLGEIEKRLGADGDIEKAIKKNAADYDVIGKLVADVQKDLLDVRKLHLERPHVARRDGEVSHDCAKFLGGLVVAAGLRQEKLAPAFMERAETELKNLLGVHAKSALTTSDIPLPVNYSGEVIELVYQYGVARKAGTVLPLSAASFKLPKLTTSTTFSLIASSGTVTEKSPAVAWVTFTPEKFGGLVRMPSEIDEDSIVAMGQFLARYAARQIAQVEDYNFFRSTGAASGQNGTAEGLTKSVVTDSMFYYNGGASNSGKTKQSDATLADFRTLRTIQSGAVLGRAKYYVHPTYEQLFCSFNTSATVMPYISNGANGATLDGFPIVWVPDMPAYSTSASASLVHALFGDATFNYLGIRGGARFDTSREAGFTTDEILVRALERLTVGKMATDCVSGLRNSAS